MVLGFRVWSLGLTVRSPSGYVEICGSENGAVSTLREYFESEFSAEVEAGSRASTGFGASGFGFRAQFPRSCSLHIEQVVVRCQGASSLNAPWGVGERSSFGLQLPSQSVPQLCLDAGGNAENIIGAA